MKTTCIKKGILSGFEYRILHTRGRHYCAYVRVPRSHDLYMESYQYLNSPDVNGDLTYSGSLQVKGAWFLGWDYAHSTDLIQGFDTFRKPKHIEFMRDISKCVLWLGRCWFNGKTEIT